MARIEAKIEALGLSLPEPFQPPPGVVLPFTWVRVRDNRAYISGHIPQHPDGSIAQPLGKVGAEVSAEQGYEAALGCRHRGRRDRSQKPRPDR